MEITGVRTLYDLNRFFTERDSDHNGKLEWEGQSPLSRFDRDHDSALSPWEVMEAVNRMNRVPVFSRADINSVKATNQGGAAFPPIQLSEGQSIEFGGRSFGAGAILEFNAGGELVDVAVPAQFTPANAQGKTITALYRYGPSGDLSAIVAVPAEPVTINGKEYAAGTGLEFDPRTGALVSASTTLASDTTINSATFPAGTDLTARPSGELIKAAARLAADTDIHGIKFRAHSQLTFESFTSTGMEVEGTLAQDTTLQVNGQPVTFQAGSKLRYRYTNGEPPQLQVLSGTPAGPYTLPGTQTAIPAGTAVSWDNEGKPGTVQLSAPLTIDGYSFGAGTTLSLNPDGQVVSAQLTADTTLMVGDKPVLFKAGTSIMFNGSKVWIGILAENGAEVEFRDDKLYSLTLSDRTGIRIADQDILLQPGSQIFFGESGKPVYIIPAIDLTLAINGEPITFQAGSILSLYEDGKVESGHFITADNLPGLGTVEAAGDIYFNDDGTPQRIVDSETEQVTYFDEDGAYNRAEGIGALSLLGIAAGRPDQDQ